MSTAVHVDDVTVTMGEACLLDHVSFSVDRGRILSVIGANGAGKTTLLDAISGVVPCHDGRVALAGAVAEYRAGRPYHGVARAFQGSPLPETLTVDEVISLVTQSRAEADELLSRFNLEPHAASFVAELSTGMRRVLDLAVTTVGEPEVVLLDEPSSGLAPSEVEHLADLILRWRDESGATVLVVEHDPALVRAISDEIIVLDAGKVLARGTPEEMLDGHGHAASRVKSPDDDEFRTALATVREHSVPAEPPMRRSVSTWTLLRLGLREFSGGLISVLILGVLNRVMKVELGIGLGLVALVLASYNLAAPFAMAVGHRSDTRPIFGKRRIPYILGGTALSGLALVLAPHVAGQLSHGITPTVIVLGILLFLLLGLGTYGSGAVYLALLADIVPERERGHAISIVYFELVLGVMAGVALSTSILDGEAGGLTTLFAIAAIVVFALTAFGVWGMEPELPEDIGESDHVPAREAFRRIVAMPQARHFFVFMTLATIFMFLQQAVLEPFGGDVLGLDVRATSAFNAVQTVGILVAMILGGRGIADRLGHKRLALYGLIGGAGSFGALALAAYFESGPPSWFAILGMGLSMGLFSVAGLALMVNMADPRHAALFMGFWTLARAIADGVSTAGGGAIFAAAEWLAGSEPGAYATVFAVEAVGLALCIPLLRRVKVTRFQDDAAGVMDAPRRRDLVAAGALD